MIVGKYALRLSALGYLTLIVLGPLAMMVWRTAEDLDGAWAAITDPDTVSAFKLTILVTVIAVAVNTLFGIVCALVIVRGNIPGRGFLNAFVDLPLALSPVIVGFSLVVLYGINGWFSWFQRNGFEILFATPGIVLATIFVTLPFVAREVVPTLREIGIEQEQAAQTLGASGWQTFWRITLPSIRWAVVYGVVLTTARAIGEFGAVAIVSGNIAGKTQTATLRVEDAYQFAYGNYAAAYGISLVLAAMAIVVLLSMLLIQRKGSRA
jgi:sulfate transport system permease protein